MLLESVNGQAPAQPTGTTPPAAPRPRSGGAPPANTNRTTHGLHGFGWPKGCHRLKRRETAFRNSLCEAVEANGAIGLYEAATIDSACQWLRHGLLAARWLRLEHDQLSPVDRLSFSREVAKAAVERDRCIRLLGLDQTAKASVWDALDARRHRERLEAAQ